MATQTFQIWRGQGGQGRFQEYRTEVSEGMVVLDAVHAIQAKQAPDLACRWNCKAGKCGSCSAEINGKPKLMCMTRLERAAGRQARHGRAAARVPAPQGSRHRRLVELRGQEEDQAVHAAPAGRARRHLAHGSRPTSTASRNSASASSVFSARTSVTSCAITASTGVHRPAASTSTSRRSRCTRSTRPIASPELKEQFGLGYCNITKCCTKVCPESHHDHRQRDHPAQGARGRSLLRSG